MLILTLSGCYDRPMIKGSGTVVEGTIDYTGFSGIYASDACDVTVTRSDTYGITVTADDNVLIHSRFRLNGNTLYIDLDPFFDYTGIQFDVAVSMPELRSVTLYHGANATLSGFSSSASLLAKVVYNSSIDMGTVSTASLELEVKHNSRANGTVSVSGATTIEADDGSTVELSGSSAGLLTVVCDDQSTARLTTFTAPNVTADVEDSSTVELTGSCTGLLTVACHNQSTARLEAFAAPDVTAEVSDGSTAYVQANDTLYYDITDSSALYYTGTGTLDKDSTVDADSFVWQLE